MFVMRLSAFAFLTAFMVLFYKIDSNMEKEMEAAIEQTSTEA